MKTFRLVLGYNFSQCADNAAVFAFSLFSSSKVDAQIVFCLSDLADVTDLTDELSDEGSVSAEGYYRDKLEAHRQGLLPLMSTGSSIEVVMVNGNPAEELPRQASLFGADMLVVGLSGRMGSMAEQMAGRTSEIVNKACLPVLVVPKEALPIAGDIRKVLYLTDFREADFSSLHKMIESLPNSGTLVYCLHFYHDKPDKWDEKRLEEWQLYCTQTYRNQNVVCEMLVGDNKLNQLSAFIADNGVQIVGMTQKHHFMVSQWFHSDITKKVLFHAQVPFVLFCD